MSNLLGDSEFVLCISSEEYLSNPEIPRSRYSSTEEVVKIVELGIIDVYRDPSSLVYQIYFKDSQSMMEFQLQYL
jgi:hypothetical protein